jgi:hypothetical protein
LRPETCCPETHDHGQQAAEEDPDAGYAPPASAYITPLPFDTPPSNTHDHGQQAAEEDPDAGYAPPASAYIMPLPFDTPPSNTHDHGQQAAEEDPDAGYAPPASAYIMPLPFDTPPSNTPATMQQDAPGEVADSDVSYAPPDSAYIKPLPFDTPLSATPATVQQDARGKVAYSESSYTEPLVPLQASRMALPAEAPLHILGLDEASTASHLPLVPPDGGGIPWHQPVEQPELTRPVQHWGWSSEQMLSMPSGETPLSLRSMRNDPGLEGAHGVYQTALSAEASAKSADLYDALHANQMSSIVGQQVALDQASLGFYQDQVFEPSVSHGHNPQTGAWVGGVAPDCLAQPGSRTEEADLSRLHVDTNQTLLELGSVEFLIRQMAPAQQSLQAVGCAPLEYASLDLTTMGSMTENFATLRIEEALSRSELTDACRPGQGLPERQEPLSHCVDPGSTEIGQHQDYGAGSTPAVQSTTVGAEPWTDEQETTFEYLKAAFGLN